MENLKQNTLEDSTTDIGFVYVINENKGENIVALQKEVTLETGETVIVEGITPNKMKDVLNSLVDGSEEAVTFLTPGEDYNEEIKGVCQVYNESAVPAELVSIEITTPATKVEYVEGETFDTTGMVVTANYSNGSTKVVTDYTFAPNGALATTDTKITVTYEEKTAEQTITVTAAPEPGPEDEE